MVMSCERSISRRLLTLQLDDTMFLVRVLHCHRMTVAKFRGHQVAFPLVRDSAHHSSFVIIPRAQKLSF